MSASIWYKMRLLYEGRIGILSDLSDRIIKISLQNGNMSDDVLAFVACLNYPMDHSLDDLSLEDVKVLTQLLIKAINELDQEGYFFIDDEDKEYLVMHNMPTDIRSDKKQALDLIKGLEEIIQELEAEEKQKSEAV